MNFDSSERIQGGKSTTGLFFTIFCNNEQQDEHNLALRSLSLVHCMHLIDEISSLNNQGRGSKKKTDVIKHGYIPGSFFFTT
jgi:hypothetical protein